MVAITRRDFPNDINLELYDYQMEPFEASKEFPYVAFCSGTGVGKSYMGARWSVLQALTGEKRSKHLAISPYSYMASLHIMPEVAFALEEMGLEERKHYKINRGLRYVRFHHNKALLLFAGADNYKGLQGHVLSSAWCDECGLYPDPAWKTIKQRRSFKNAPTLLTSTPYYWNWYKKVFEDGMNPNDLSTHSIRVETWKNPEYSREAILDNARKWDRWEFDMMFRGLFTRPKGVIWPQAIDCVIDSFEIPAHWPRWGAIDYGDVHPTAILWFAQDPITGNIYVTGEWRRSDMDAFRINEQIKNVRVPYYADTSDNLSSNTLKRLGNNMLPAVKKVLDGIMEVTGLFNTGKLFIFKNCQELINETTGYMWELDRNGDPKERPVKKNDDLCDALRYGVNSWIATPPMETVGGVAIPRSGGILSGFSAKARRRRR